MTDRTAEQIFLTRRSQAYWRVTFDHPPFNIFGPESIPHVNAIVSALEIDQNVKVVVFDSAVDGFFLTHYDFVPPLEESTGIPPGPTGLQPLPDMLVRLSRAPVVSIVSIRGRATGVGSELALASDMRFASLQKAILSQWEVGAGLVPGGGPMARLPRLMGRGRALEVLLGADDIDGELAERYGYVNRSFPMPSSMLRRRTRAPDLVLRQAGDRGHEATGRREQPAAGRRDRTGMGRLPDRSRTAGNPSARSEVVRARLSPTRGRRNPARLSPRAAWCHRRDPRGTGGLLACADQTCKDRRAASHRTLPT